MLATRRPCHEHQTHSHRPSPKVTPQDRNPTINIHKPWGIPTDRRVPPIPPETASAPTRDLPHRLCCRHARRSAPIGNNVRVVELLRVTQPLAHIQRDLTALSNHRLALRVSRVVPQQGLDVSTPNGA